MSKERETLITDLGIGDRDGFFYITQKLQAEIREPLTQKRESSASAREMYQRGYAKAELDLKRDPLSYSRTADLFHANKKATDAVCYWAGVSDAEKAHGIGVDNE